MTNAELAVLTLLAEQPRHGYELEQVIEARGMREWTEVGFSSIYYVLKKLEQEGLIYSQRTPSQGRGPGRKVYALTEQGNQALQEAILWALSEPQRCYTPFQLGLANLPALEPKQALAALRNYRMQLQAAQTHLRSRRQAQQPLPANVEAMFDYSLHMIQAERDWVSNLIQRMEAADEQGGL
jgi:DNA-binding PadR family transcriptional regulator